MAQRRPSKTINTLGPGWPRSEDRAMCSGGITTRAPTGLSHRKTVQAARPVVHPTGRDQPGSIPQLAGAAASAQCRIRTKLDAHASAHGWKSAICGPLRRQIRPCTPATNLHIIPANSSSAHTTGSPPPKRGFLLIRWIVFLRPIHRNHSVCLSLRIYPTAPTRKNQPFPETR